MLKSKSIISITIISLVSFFSTSNTAFANQTNWNTTASQYNGRLEQDFTYNCPSGGRVTRVWGTDVYTIDSPVCSAAVHAGLITARDGGKVTIRIKSSQSSFVGTTRNGVTSSDYGSYGSSYIFLNSKGSETTPNAETIPLLKWGVSAANLQGKLEQDFRYRCLPDGRVNGVWGTDIYTIDSSICSAAVHAGLITAKNGGIVTIRIKPGESSYTGTRRNGVTSRNYGGYGASFTFVK